jgi:hypothetical protein
VVISGSCIKMGGDVKALVLERINIIHVEYMHPQKWQLNKALA